MTGASGEGWMGVARDWIGWETELGSSATSPSSANSDRGR